MEEKYLKAARESAPVILVRGQKLLVSRDLPAYIQAMRPLPKTQRQIFHSRQRFTPVNNVKKAPTNLSFKDAKEEKEENEAAEEDDSKANDFSPDLSSFNLLDTTEHRVRMVAVNNSVYYAMEG
ncbi:hypothetical protein SK128_017395 [Halocaridina rubra]|uniref:Uncharacterized protein n=1 Tax=Halocaridina rubra TaxID=373956 RepID=A0AAN8WMA8_HALRR